MRITNDGNVGIGTTNPSSALEVIGSIRNKNASGNANFSQLSTSESTLTISTYSVNTSSYPAPIIFSPNLSERMRITDAGNVGIGITSPTQKLHVSGNIAQTLGTATTTHFVGITGSLTTNTVVASLDVSTQPAYGVFFDYVVYDDTEPPANARAGNIMTVNNNSTSRYTDTSTSDIGDTTPVDFSTSISGNNLLLTANIASGTWYVRLNYRRF